MTLATLLIAMVLENESLPAGSATLHYVFVPQLLVLLCLHLWIACQQEPWLVALGGGAAAATTVVGAVLGLRPAGPDDFVPPKDHPNTAEKVEEE